jgi:hypothetical protein
MMTTILFQNTYNKLKKKRKTQVGYAVKTECQYLKSGECGGYV